MIEIRDVVKTFDGFRALDGVTMTVPRGAVYGLSLIHIFHENT